MKFSDATIAKAERYLSEERVTPSDHPNRYWVQGSAVYLVRTDLTADGRATYMTCTCPHSEYNPGPATCAHAAAVALFILDPK